MDEKKVVLYQKPHINLAWSTAGRMWLVSLCAGLAIFQSSVTDAFASLIIAITVMAAAIITEFLIYFRTEKAGMVKDGSAITSALLLALLLPNQIHPLYAALGAVFAMTVVKHSFGGLGANWMNPAVGGWLFIRFSWPAAFNNAIATAPVAMLQERLERDGSNFPDLTKGFTQGSPLEILKVSGISDFPVGGSPFDNTVATWLNKTIFSITGSELPGGYIDLLTATTAGIIADRGLLALLLGTIIIVAFQVTRSWVPAVYLGMYGLLIRIFGALPFGGALGAGDILFGFFSGGTMVAAFLLVTDPATGPKSKIGTLITAFLAACFTYIFRYQGSEVYGAFFAVALMNVLVPLIRDIESRRLYVAVEPAKGGIDG
ncbi:MAG: RnfABCDGE type electron transport complex subunit D [Treponema sp.]|jgi:electron transport complex protein RnfD|nr:RnfABCDGE type electron transport complex subunit D [Treponema sp.]